MRYDRTQISLSIEITRVVFANYLKVFLVLFIGDWLYPCSDCSLRSSVYLSVLYWYLLRLHYP